MKFEVEVDKKEKRAIEVEFPLYLKGGDSFDSGGWYETYSRIDADGYEYEITVNDRGEWRYDKSKINLASHLGYCLVERTIAYKVIKADEFYSMVDELQKSLAEIPR